MRKNIYNTYDVFCENLEQLLAHTTPKHIAVAVSGGGDSMGLALLLHKWCDINTIHLTALIVDHKLRNDSTQEAIDVKNRLQALGIETVILTNNTVNTGGSLQNYARDIRYALLSGWCRNNHVYDMCVAHHYMDDLETTALRCESGSKQYGKAGISAVRHTPFGRIIRPVLVLEKHHLLEVCDENGLAYVNDKSNENLDFSRVRLRKALEASRNNTEASRNNTIVKSEDRISDRVADSNADMDINRKTDSAQYLYHQIQQIQQDAKAYRKNLESVGNTILVRTVQPHMAGFAIINQNLFDYAPDYGIYVLQKVLLWVSNTVYAPRHHQIVALYNGLQCAYEKKDITLFKGDTLHKCCIRVLQGKIYVYKEIAHLEQQNLAQQNLKQQNLEQQNLKQQNLKQQNLKQQNFEYTTKRFTVYDMENQRKKISKCNVQIGATTAQLKASGIQYKRLKIPRSILPTIAVALYNETIVSVYGVVLENCQKYAILDKDKRNMVYRPFI